MLFVDEGLEALIYDDTCVWTDRKEGESGLAVGDALSPQMALFLTFTVSLGETLQP